MDEKDKQNLAVSAEEQKAEEEANQEDNWFVNIQRTTNIMYFILRIAGKDCVTQAYSRYNIFYENWCTRVSFWLLYKFKKYPL